MEYGGTAYNRTVYASPPVGGSGYGFARSIASLIPTQNLRHSLSALRCDATRIRAAKTSYTAGTLCASFLKLVGKYIDKILKIL
jgi:hypothetical protein